MLAVLGLLAIGAFAFSEDVRELVGREPESGGGTRDRPRGEDDHGARALPPITTPDTLLPAGPPDAPYELGTVSDSRPGARLCPDGFECQAVTLSCPDSPVTRAEMAVGIHTGPATGLAVFFSGLGGNLYWAQRTDVGTFFTDLRASGIEVVLVRWRESWIDAEPGNPVGPARLACVGATIMKWVHDTIYTDLGVSPAPGRCGFCVTGNSGGASMVTYALARYGLEDVVDGLIPTSGPPHAALRKGCAGLPGEEVYAYGAEGGRRIDGSYGFDTAGPCSTGNPAFIPRWEEDQVNGSGADFTYSTTRVHVIIGARDDEHIRVRGRDYASLLERSGSPWVELEELAEMGHEIDQSPAGLEALEQAILGAP